MKRVIQISMLFFLVVSFGSCKKSETSNSLAGNSLAGKQYKAVEANIYEIPENNQGDCEGWYIQATNPDFDFYLKIDAGLTDSIKTSVPLDSTHFLVDFTFTGKNYYCQKPYGKRIAQNGDYPYEIQMVRLTKVVINN